MTIGAFTAATDTGRKRRRNEDAFVCAPPLFAVADGMGGAQAGEVASQLAAAALSDTDPARCPATERVVELIQEANRRVYERSRHRRGRSGMGTTMTVALVEGRRGRDRARRRLARLPAPRRTARAADGRPLARRRARRSGKLSPEEAETHPQRSVITRALGTDPDVDVDAFSVRRRTATSS